MIEASCLCGGITFIVHGELEAPRYCHCSHCRKFSGTAHGAWAMARTSEVMITNHEAEIAKYNSGRGLRNFCSRCGSPLFFESIDESDIVMIPLGSIDTGPIEPPVMHIWVKSKPVWSTIDAQLPQHSTYPGDG